MPRLGKRNGESRHGKHAPEMFRVSLYLSAEEKAVAAVLAELQGRTITDILKSGLVFEATRAGIMSNGRVAGQFRSRVDAYRRVMEAEVKARRKF